MLMALATFILDDSLRQDSLMSSCSTLGITACVAIFNECLSSIITFIHSSRILLSPHQKAFHAQMARSNQAKWQEDKKITECALKILRLLPIYQSAMPSRSEPNM